MAGQNPNENNKAVANLLLKEGLATKEQIQKAIAHQKKSDKNPSLLRVLVGMKVLDKDAAQKIQVKMKSAETPAPAKPSEPAKPTGGFTFAEDDDEVLAREKKAGSLGVQMFDGNADISGIDLAEDDSDKIMKKKADYFEPVEAAAKKQNQQGQQQAKKKKKGPVDPNDLRCQNCGAKVKENQRRCKECGMPIDLDELRSRPQDLSKKSWKMYAIPAVVLIVVAIAVIFFMGEKQAHDEEEARLTKEEQEQKQKEKNNKKAIRLRERVAKIEEIDSWKDREEEAILCEKIINEFCESTGFPTSRFEAQFKAINRYKEAAEEKRKEIEEAKNKYNDDDETGDDDDEDVGDDDDEDNDNDNDKKMTPNQLEKFNKFKQALEDLFTAYKPGWTEPSKEFNDAVGRLKNTSFRYPMQYLVETMLNDEAPITALPEITKDDKEILTQTDPWGICIELLQSEGKRWLKTKEWKDKIFEIYKKYVYRFPYPIVSRINSVGKEYLLQLGDFLHEDTKIDNAKQMDSINYAKKNMLGTLVKLDKKYDDQVAEILKPVLKHEILDWAKIAFNWLLSQKPEMIIEEAIEWLFDESNEKSGYAKNKLRDLAKNDNVSQEIKTEYATKIAERIKDMEMPDVQIVRIIIEMDNNKGIEVLTRIMKNKATVDDQRYSSQLRAIVRDTYRDEMMTNYPIFIENTEICVEHRRWLFEELTNREEEKHFEEIMDLLFRLLVDENDELDPLNIANKMIEKAKANGKDIQKYWPRFKVFFDKHSRKDGFELFMAMNICDPSKAMDEALAYIFDDKANDGSRGKILEWVGLTERNDETLLEYCDKILKSTNKPGIKTLVVIETIKVDRLFKKCDNEEFEIQGPRQNKAAIDSAFSTILAVDKKGNSYITANLVGDKFKVYNLRAGNYTLIDRKKLSEAWAKFKKDKAEWDALEKKGDKLEPKPPSGEEIDFKDQFVAVSIYSAKQIRFLTTNCMVEYWTSEETSFNPAIKGGPKYPGYCTKKRSLNDKIKELKGLSLNSDNVITSADGNIIAVKIAGFDVLIIDIERQRLISKLSPGNFSVMRLDEEGKTALFYGGDNKKTTVYDVTKPDRGVVIDMAMEKYDYAGFGADRKTIFVSNNGFLWRFDSETGEKLEIYIVPALIVDSSYYTFIMDGGKYLGEVRKNKVRIRKIKNGKTEAATGKIDDDFEITYGRYAISEDGKVIVFLMQDQSAIVYKIG